jgi:hypothetical protein
MGVVLSPYYAALLTCLLAEELARMKEKDRLRKEYVEELRKRHEEEASRLEAQLAKEQRARREEQAARVEVLFPESFDCVTFLAQARLWNAPER